ncbi:hypothetical protein BJX70DRAFT_43386 [Aspergillus crustosus]
MSSTTVISARPSENSLTIASKESSPLTLKVISKEIKSNTCIVDMDAAMTPVVMEERAMNELTYRDNRLLQSDGNLIHHFNWQRRPVFNHSSTPPEVSLWVMLSDAPDLTKPALRGFRVRTIFKNAMTYVDPVVVDYDIGDPLSHGTDLPRFAAGLIRIARGRTFKYYTRHGTWRSDAQEGKTRLDEGDSKHYCASNVRVGNGFIQHNTIRANMLWEYRRYLAEGVWRSRRMQRLVERRNAKLRKPHYIPSPLRNCVTAV